MRSSGKPANAPAHLRTSHIVGVALGNAFEFYDFVTYSFFAIYIGRTFFPSADPATSLLASLATFGAGFLTRPIGALVIGRLADRVGRKPMMLLTFALIGTAMSGIALTPSYAAIGIAAPILVVFFRLLQGFALGGEVGPSTAFLAEAAPPTRRGLYVSFQFMSADAAALAAGLIGFALSSLLDDSEMTRFGWRLAFLFGALIIPVGLVLRRSLVETLDRSTGQSVAAPPAAQYRRIAILGLLALMALTIASYILDYMTTYAIATLHMPANLAFGATIMLGLSGVLFDPVGGWLSDRFGRKPVMLIPWTILLIAIMPAFWLLSRYPTAPMLYGAVFLLYVPQAIASSSVLVGLTESLPARVRSGSLAIIYALAISVFGGSAQFIVSWMTVRFASPLAPAWYLSVAAVVGLIAMLLMRESAPVRGGLRPLADNRPDRR